MKHLLSLIFVGLVGIMSAQNPEEGGMTLDREAWEELRSERSYDSAQKNEPPKEKPKPDSDPVASPSFDIPSPVLYGIAILLALIALFFILKNALRPNKLKPERIEAESIEDAEENLPDVTLNKIHAEAVDSGDFKSALRIKFLMLLQVLIDEKLVLWKKRKTNEQFLYEIADQGQKFEFSQIVELYDKVWYGSGNITEVQYNLVSGQIDVMKSGLSND